MFRKGDGLINVEPHGVDWDYICPIGLALYSDMTPWPDPLLKNNTNTFLVEGGFIDNTTNTWDDIDIPKAQGYAHVYEPKLTTSQTGAVPMHIKFEINKPVYTGPQPSLSPRLIACEIRVTKAPDTSPCHKWEWVQASETATTWYVETDWDGSWYSYDCNPQYPEAPYTSGDCITIRGVGNLQGVTADCTASYVDNWVSVEIPQGGDCTEETPGDWEPPEGWGEYHCGCSDQDSTVWSDEDDCCNRIELKCWNGGLPQGCKHFELLYYPALTPNSYTLIGVCEFANGQNYLKIRKTNNGKRYHTIAWFNEDHEKHGLNCCDEGTLGSYDWRIWYYDCINKILYNTNDDGDLTPGGCFEGPDYPAGNFEVEGTEDSCDTNSCPTNQRCSASCTCIPTQE